MGAHNNKNNYADIDLDLYRNADGDVDWDLVDDLIIKSLNRRSDRNFNRQGILILAGCFMSVALGNCDALMETRVHTVQPAAASYDTNRQP